MLKLFSSPVSTIHVTITCYLLSQTIEPSLHNFFHKLKDSHNINNLLFICKKRSKSEPTRIN